MHVTIHPTLTAGDWASEDFDTPQEALDELEALLEDDPSTLTLIFHPTPIPGTSLPGLWRLVRLHLAAHSYHGDVHLRVPGPVAVGHCVRYLPLHQRPRTSLRSGLHLTVGDLADARADAVVHASNRRLKLGGGVSHALRVRFGESLQSQLWAVARSIEDGEGVVTEHPPSTGVRALYHVASAAGDVATIRRCLETVSRLATERGDAHVILPALGTGTGGLSMEAFAEVLRAHPLEVSAELWCWTRKDYDTVLAVWGGG